MNIWTIGISLEKPSFLLIKLSIVNSPWLWLTKKIINMLVEFGPSLGSKIWGVSRHIPKNGCYPISKRFRSF